MATPLDTKKKLRPDADVAGFTAPLVRPQGTQIGHLTLQPGSGADTAAKAIGGFFGGLKDKRAQFFADGPQIPTIPLGAPSPIPAAQAAPAPTAPLPHPVASTANATLLPSTTLQGGAIPARNPASPAASAGAAPPAGGVPAPSLIAPLSSGVNAQGNNVYDNASIARLTERNAAGGVPAQSFGGLPMPSMTAAPAITPTQAPAVQIPRPARADAFNVRQADQNTGKIASALEDAAFRTGLRASRGSRSAADAQASILQTLAQLGGQRLGVAAGIAGGDRDATAGNDRTALGETGANQRAALTDTGATTRAGIEQAGNERVAQIGSLADMARVNAPTTITDENGNLLRVTGGTAAPVVGPDGKPVKPAATKQAGAITPAMQFEQDSKTLQTLLANPPLAGDDAAAAAYQQQLAQLQQKLAGYGNSAAGQAPSGMTLVGTTKDGKKVYRDASGKTFSE